VDAARAASIEPAAGTPRARTFALTWLSYFSYYFTRKPFSVAKNAIKHALGVSKGTLAAIDTTYLGAYAVGQFAWGAAADRIGPRRVIAGGMLATAIVSVLFGLSSAVPLFLALSLLNGVAQSSGWSSNIKTMCSVFPPEGRGSVMGAWVTNYQLGSMISGPLAAFFITRFASWRAAFIGPAFWVALVGLAIFFFLPERRVAQDPTFLEEVRRERGRVYRTPLVWALAGAYFFMKLTRYVLQFWLVYFMQNQLRYGTSKATWASIAFELGGTTGAVSIGVLSDKVLGGKRLGVSILCLVGLAAALPLYGAQAPLGLAHNFLALALVGFFLYGPDSLLSGAAAQDLGGAAAAATAAGIINGGGSIGATFQGPLAAALSWSNVLWVLAGGSIVAGAILAPFWITSRRASRAAS
jgi:sugar phosphate permease